VAEAFQIAANPPGRTPALSRRNPALPPGRQRPSELARGGLTLTQFSRLEIEKENTNVTFSP
jgi:hypothetical protein